MAPSIARKARSVDARGQPTFTPRLRTIWVSNGLVSIATRNPHSGQRNVTVSEPSSGPSVECSFIGWSQSRQRNFIVASAASPARTEGGLFETGGVSPAHSITARGRVAPRAPRRSQSRPLRARRRRLQHADDGERIDG